MRANPDIETADGAPTERAEDRAEPARILELLAATYGGPAWHGPSLREALAGVTADEATARPLAGSHTITEIVLHLTVWLDEVRERLGGRAPGQPPRGDWPTAEGINWPEVEAALDRAYGELVAVVRELPPARLREQVGKGAEAVSLAAMLYGLAHHFAYHTGQIPLLRRAGRADHQLPGLPAA